MSVKNDIVWLGLAGVAVYLVIKYLSNKIPVTVEAARQAAASDVADIADKIFAPPLCAQGASTYTVTMVDGSVQTVPCGYSPNSPQAIAATQDAQNAQDDYYYSQAFMMG
ncbi:MAG: hypothetical protein ACRETL_06965 [Gammaproteobacteria bacterium]